MTVHINFDVSATEGCPEALAGHAQFVNDGDVSVTFLPMQVESPSLAMEILDSKGCPVRLPPPPIPDPSARPIELAPGAIHQVDYPSFLPSWTEPGQYRVRARFVVAGQEPGAAVLSDWIDITVLD